MSAENTNKRFLLVAGLAESLINFRGPLITALIQQGLEVHVAAPEFDENSAIRFKLESMGVNVHSIPMDRTSTKPVDDIKTLLHLWMLMIRLKPRYILAYTVKPVIYGTLAAWLARVPRRFALITGLGYAFQESADRDRLKQLVQRLYCLALSKSHLVFFQNMDDLILFRQRGILEKHIDTRVVNGSGVDLAQFPVSPSVSNPIKFLLIARLLGDKGVREYVRAAQMIKVKYPNVVCMLVGWIDSNPDSIQQSELDSWVAEGSIKFLGRTDNVCPAIAECSVYVLPSYREGTPRTVLEAMSMGRPIITTDAPGCRETVIHGENGFLVPTKSVEAIVLAMEKFISDPTLISKMGRVSRKIAEDKYDVSKVNQLMITAMDI